MTNNVCITRFRNGGVRFIFIVTLNTHTHTLEEDTPQLVEDHQFSQNTNSFVMTLLFICPLAKSFA